MILISLLFSRITHATIFSCLKVCLLLRGRKSLLLSSNPSVYSLNLLHAVKTKNNEQTVVYNKEQNVRPLSGKFKQNN